MQRNSDAHLPQAAGAGRMLCPSRSRRIMGGRAGSAGVPGSERAVRAASSSPAVEGRIE